MYQEDLSRSTFGGFDMMLSAGWLCKEHEYRKGAVSEAFTSRLAELLKYPVQDPFTRFFMFGGPFSCALCPPENQPQFQTVAEVQIPIGRHNLFVPKPNSDLVYLAPSTIIHYVIEHGYMPPEEFQDAVMKCPRMASGDYYREMKRRAANVWSWWKFFKSQIS